MARATVQYSIGGRRTKFVIRLPKRMKVTDDMLKRIKAPMAEGNAGKRVVDAIRYGEGSISQQFDLKTFWHVRGTTPWDRTKKFGTKPKPRGGTLHNTGRLRAAWLGGSGNDTNFRSKSVSVGVDTSQFPAAKIQQSSKRYTNILVTKRMRGFLWANYKVWVAKSHIRVGNRRLGFNNKIKKRIRAVVKAWVVSGKRITVR